MGAGGRQRHGERGGAVAYPITGMEGGVTVPRLTALLAGTVLIVTACTATTSPAPATPVGTSDGSHPPPTPIVTPTATATFADPNVGVVAVRIDIYPDVRPFEIPTLSVYEDGRVLRQMERADQLVVRHLTGDGVEAIRGELLDSGFFGRDAEFRPPVPPPHGFMTYAATVRTGGRTVTVVATNTAGTSEATAFIALLERIVPLEAWLPDETWLDLHPEPYQARHFWLFTDSSPGVLATYPEPPSFTADVDDVARLFPIPIHEFGAPIPRFVQDFPRFRCGVIDPETAGRLLSVLQLRGYQAPPPGFLLAQFDLSWRATNGIFMIWLQPLLPDTSPSCEPVTWAY